MIIIDIMIESEKWHEAPLMLEENTLEKTLNSLLRRGISACLTVLQRPETPSELSIVFIDDHKMQDINKKWRNKNTSTNVLSFPAFPLKIDEPYNVMLGDILFAYETIFNEAKKQQKSFQDHLTHLFIHGFLHLLGYDHQTEHEAEIMEEIERKILQNLSINDPYALNNK